MSDSESEVKPPFAMEKLRLPSGKEIQSLHVPFLAHDVGKFIDPSPQGEVLSVTTSSEGGVISMDQEEQAIYDQTVAAVSKGQFSSAFGKVAVQLHQIRRDMATKTDIEDLKQLLNERLPPKP